MAKGRFTRFASLTPAARKAAPGKRKMHEMAGGERTPLVRAVGPGRNVGGEVVRW